MIRCIIAGVLGVLTLAACHSEVRTDVRVDAAGRLDAHVTVTLRDEAATAAADTLDELRAAVATNAGVGPDSVDVDTGDGEVRASVSLNYQQLSGAGDLTGVAAVEQAAAPAGVDAGDDDRAVVVTVVRPARLEQAIADAARSAAVDDADAAALEEAALGSVEVAVRVSFPGGVTDAYFVLGPNGDTATPPPLREADTYVELRQPLNRFSGGRLVVVGDPTSSRRSNNLWVAAGIVTAAAAAAAVARDRRRS